MENKTLEHHIDSVSGACFAAAAVIRYLAQESEFSDIFKSGFTEVAINAEDTAVALLKAYRDEDETKPER